MRDYKLSVAAGETVIFNRQGNYVKVTDAQGSIEIDFSGGRMLTLQKGAIVKKLQFDSLTITNTETTSQTLVLTIGANGEEVESTGAVTVLGGSVDIAPGGSYEGLPFINKTESDLNSGDNKSVVAENSKRKKLIVMVGLETPDSTLIYVTHDYLSFPPVPHGIPLKRGQFFEISASSAVALTFNGVGTVYVSEVVE